MSEPSARGPQQQGLWGAIEPQPNEQAPVAPHLFDEELSELATKLPEDLRMGTSSWMFPGWRGLVYAKKAAQKHLSRHGLAAYSQHPLLRAAGVDRTFYAPIDQQDFEHNARQVPESFRFLVKVWAEITSPVLRGQTGTNERYLDPDSAIDLCLAPAFEGLGDKLGPLVFQFPPQGAAITKKPEAFADRLHAFFAKMPKSAQYRVELRDAALLSKRYVEALADSCAQHCFCVHARMPSIQKQRELVPIDGPVAVRWMLQQGFGYDEAKERYQPFDRLVDPDPESRAEIAELARDAIAAHVPMTVVVNNKAEGSAPLSIVELARMILAAQ